MRGRVLPLPTKRSARSTAVSDPLRAYAERMVDRVEWPCRGDAARHLTYLSPHIHLKRERSRNMYLNEYIRRIAQETIGLSVSVYRGQGDRLWGLESAAYRRLKHILNKERPGTDDHINYNEQLLETARLKGLHQRGFRELCDLELLAELQHLGAATCLMDFTWNAGVALLSVETRLKADFPYETDAQWPIESSLLTEHHWYWTPEGLNSRIQKQDSAFVFNGSGIWPEPYPTVRVRRRDKASLLGELRILLNISEEALFGDIHGFAQLHGVGRK